MQVSEIIHIVLMNIILLSDYLDSINFRSPSSLFTRPQFTRANQKHRSEFLCHYFI